MHMHDTADVAAQQGGGITAGEQAVAGVEQQPDRWAAVAQHQIDLAIGLHDGSHVVMERHADTERRHAVGERGELLPVGGPFVVAQARTLRERLEDCRRRGGPMCRHTRRPCSQIAQQGQVRQDRGEFLVDVAIEDAAVIPAGDKAQMVAREQRPEFGGRTRKLAAELGARVAGEARLGRQVSSGMSPPSSGISSLVQVMGLMPISTAIMIVALSAKNARGGFGGGEGGDCVLGARAIGPSAGGATRKALSLQAQRLQERGLGVRRPEETALLGVACAEDVRPADIAVREAPAQ
jgi:hypothetical protein